MTQVLLLHGGHIGSQVQPLQSKNTESKKTRRSHRVKTGHTSQGVRCNDGSSKGHIKSHICALRFVCLLHKSERCLNICTRLLRKKTAETRDRTGDL